MMNLKVAIICSDTLSAMGLKSLLHSHFNLDASIISHEQHQLLADMAMSSDFDFFIVDENTLVQNLNFFLPYRNKVILASPSRNNENNHSLKTITTTLPVESIVSALGKILKSSHLPSQKSNSLSAREIEVLKLVAAGKLNKEIANNLNISINTVLTHRKNITAKLGIKSTSGLSFYAIMNGFIKP
jgi:DNA-binding CsgD family transcriptional regulator